MFYLIGLVTHYTNIFALLMREVGPLLFISLEGVVL